MARSRLLFAPFVVLLVISISALSCSSELEGQNGGQGNRRGGLAGAGKTGLGAWGAQIEAIPVDVISPWRANLASYVFGNAHVEALRVVEIVARVEGLLQTLAVEEGDRVTRGQVLAELDKTELRLSLAEAAARLENNRSAFERASQMLEKELTSQETLDKAKFDNETAKAQHERAQLNLQYATITAPYDGVISSRMVEKGDMIRSGTVLFRLADTEKLLLRIYVPEKDMGRVSVGNYVRVESEMFPGQHFSALVEMIAPVVDPATGTIKITAHVTAGRDKLKPGMFCSVYILIDTHENALVINRKALIPDTEVPEVFALDDSLREHRRQLTAGLIQGDTLEVLKGLSESDRVVLIGQESLHEGALVRISSAAPDSAAAPAPPSAPALGAESQKPGRDNQGLRAPRP